MATSQHCRTKSLPSAHGSPTSAKPPCASPVAAGVKKKFGCHFPACGKSFSRSEHLHRHALNHKEGNNTCLRCSAHFRRRDLLDRHMARHKEKDDEAGGEGLGVLATRKRLWRDQDGKIVNARRPASINAPQQPGKLSIDTASVTAAASTKRRPSSARERKSKANAALPSPPMSSMSSQTRSVSPHARSAPATGPLPQSAYLSNSPPAHVPVSHKMEDAPPLDPWLAANHHGLQPLPLPSPPMSEASLGSATQPGSAPLHAQQQPPPPLAPPSQPPSGPHAHAPHAAHHHHHSASHDSASLYDEPHHSAWPMIHPHPDASPEHHGHPRSQPGYLHATPPQWAPHPPPQPFQTFMGSVGSHEHPHGYAPEEEEMNIFKPEIGVSAPMGVGVSMGLGMYDWNNGQPAWAHGNMMSRVREERFDSPAASAAPPPPAAATKPTPTAASTSAHIKREPATGPWTGYAAHTSSPVFGSRSFSRC